MKKILIALCLMIATGVLAQSVFGSIHKVKGPRGKKSAAAPAWDSTPSVAWWKMNYPAGRYRDESAYGNNFFPSGTSFSNVTYTAGTTAPYYNGSTDFMKSYAVLPTTFNTNNGMTVSVWLKSAVAKQTDATGVFSMEDVSPGFIMTTFNANPSTYAFLDLLAWYQSTVAIGTDWHNWTATVRNQVLTFYVDGTNVYSVANANNISYNNVAYLGKLTTAGRWQGYIGRVDAYDTQLSSNQIYNIANNTYQTTNIVLSCKFNEAVTNTVNDSVSTNHLVINSNAAGEPSWTSSNSYSFSGTTYLTNAVSLGLSNVWTISFWANPSANDAVSIYCPVSLVHGATNDIMVLAGGNLTSGDNVAGSIGFEQDSGAASVTTGGVWAAADVGAWHMITLTYDGTTPQVFKDAVLQGMAKTNYNATLSAATTMRVAKGFADNNWPYLGQLDDIRIWGTVLLQTNVTQLYSEGRK